MAVKTESKLIGEATYYCTQWSAQKAMLMKFKLAKSFGASIAILASLVKEEKDEIGKEISEGLNSLFEANSPEALVLIIKECVRGVGVEKDGAEAIKISDANFDMIFDTDELMDIYKVFFFVIGTNYSNLLKSQKFEGILAKTKTML